MFERLKKKMGLGRQTYPVHFAAMPQTAEVHEPDHRPLPDFARRGPGVRIVKTPMDAFTPLPPIRPMSPMRASMMIPPQGPLPPIPKSDAPEPSQASPLPNARKVRRKIAKTPQLSVIVEGDDPRRTLQRAALNFASDVLAKLAEPPSPTSSEGDSFPYDRLDFVFGTDAPRPDSMVLDDEAAWPLVPFKRPRLPQDRIGIAK